MSGFSLVTPLQIAGVSDRNFLVKRARPEERLFILPLSPGIQPLAPDLIPRRLDDQVLVLTMPMLAYQRDSRRFEVTATYMPEFEVFQKYSDQNAWNSLATASFTYFPSRRAQITLGDQYRASQDPVRVLQNAAILLTRGPYRNNSIRAEVAVEASPLTVFIVGYDNVITSFGQADTFQARVLDSVAHGVSFTARRLLTRRQRLSGAYLYFTLKPIGKRGANNNALDATHGFEHPVHSVKLAYKLLLSASSSLDISGGLASLDTGMNYSLRVGGYRRFGEFWVGGGFSRELSFTSGVPIGEPDGLAAGGFYDIVMVRMSGQPARRVGLRIEATGLRDASGRRAVSSHSLVGRARADYRWTDRTVTFVSVETYQQKMNDLVPEPLSRNRFIVGIEFSFSGETQRRVNSLNQEEQYVALTDHGRRRQRPQ